MATYQEQLEQVQAAITTIITSGQSYAIGGRSLTRANLPDLERREKWLLAMISRETAGATGCRVRYVEPS